MLTLFVLRCPACMPYSSRGYAVCLNTRIAAAVPGYWQRLTHCPPRRLPLLLALPPCTAPLDLTHTTGSRFLRVPLPPCYRWLPYAADSPTSVPFYSCRCPLANAGGITAPATVNAIPTHAPHGPFTTRGCAGSGSPLRPDAQRLLPLPDYTVAAYAGLYTAPGPRFARVNSAADLDHLRC